jgi:DHA2 family multidrug resistance protein-like MFS transporter
MLPLVWAIKTGAHDGASWGVAGALVVAAGSAVIFVRRQNRSATPMLDMKLFRYAPFASSILANFLSIVGLIGFIFFVSQHLQLVLGLSPLAAGLVTLPGAIVSMIAGIGVVRLVRWLAPHHVIVAGLLLISAGFFLIFAFRHDLTVAAVVVSFIVLELGVGASQTITNDTIVASVPPAKAGAASAVSETAYELGAVVGTAVLGTIFTAFYRTNIDVPPGLTVNQAADAGESIGGAVAVAGTMSDQIASRLLDSARAAFDSGIAPTSIIAGSLTLIAAAVVALSHRGSGRVDLAEDRHRPLRLVEREPYVLDDQRQ